MSEKICDNCFHYHFLFDYCSKGYKVGDRSTCDEFFTEKDKNFKKGYKRGRCNPCPYAEEMNASDGWCFLGCFHKPYNGKWVVEIKDCPKEKTMIFVDEIQEDWKDICIYCKHDGEPCNNCAEASNFEETE